MTISDAISGNSAASRTIPKNATGACRSTIIVAIHAIIAGNVYLSERMKNHMIHRSVGRKSLDRKTPIETLSNRELEVFRMIGNGLTTSEIAKSLHLSVKTVETHRQRIKHKLQLDNANKLVREAAQWVLENG